MLIVVVILDFSFVMDHCVVARDSRLRQFLFGMPIVPMQKLRKSCSKMGVSSIEKVRFGFVTFYVNKREHQNMNQLDSPKDTLPNCLKSNAY
jgi:hypothetical protein